MAKGQLNRGGNLQGIVNLDVLADLCRGVTVEFPEPLPPHSARLMRTLGVDVRYPEHPVGMSAAAEPLAAVSAHDAAASRDCKTPNCPHEADSAMGRFAGLCRYCKQRAMQDPVYLEQHRQSVERSAQLRSAIANGPRVVRSRALVELAEKLAQAATPESRKNIERACVALKAAARDLERVEQGVAAAVRQEQEIRERLRVAYLEFGQLCGLRG